MRRIAIGVVLVGGASCAFDVPVPLEAPAVTMDVSAPVTAAVDASCSSDDAPTCAGIAALCAAEADAPCMPVSLPAQFPKQVDGQDAGSLLPAALVDAARPQAAVPVDLTGLLAAAGADDPSKVENVTIAGLALAFVDNALTFDAPVLDLYVGEYTTSIDAPLLIEQGAVVKFGTLGQEKDAQSGEFTVGQRALTSGKVPVTFNEGGEKIFNDRVKQFKFVLVAAAPAGQNLRLASSPADDSKYASPTGKTDLVISGDLVYTIDPLQLASDAADAATQQ
jgi:hypothetical protein